jgi:hypothetical protein
MIDSLPASVSDEFCSRVGDADPSSADLNCHASLNT